MNRTRLLYPHWRSWRSMALSIALHLSLLAAMIFFCSQTWKRRGLSTELRRVEVVLAQRDQSEQLQYLSQADQPPLDSQLDPGSAQVLPDRPPPTVTGSPSAAPEARDHQLDLLGLDASEMARVPGNFGKLQSDGQLTAAERAMLAREQAELAASQPKGPPASIRVFQSAELVGRRFIFVLDRSKSMGSEGLNVLDRAARELSAAISSLSDHHQFQVIAYHHQTVTISQRTLLWATEANQRLVGDFISNLASFGGTEHESALLYALSFEPDVILLLTDGGLPELNAGQLARIHRANKGDAQIHCVQFGSGPLQNPDNFLRKLASDNQGSYRYLDVSQWRDD